jgi:nicotinate-nucleotide adenylyltransferase
MRIGLFGGSFNPIHLGHLRAAEEDREALALDLIYFIPAAMPPHKPHGGLAPAEHRLQMVRLATAGNRYFMVSDVEIRRPGQSYTVDTVRHFLTALTGPAELNLIMGADQFAELATWKEANELVRLCNLAVHKRHAGAGEVETPIPLATINYFGYSRAQDYYVHPSGHTLTFVATTFLPISATLVRQHIVARKSVRYLVADGVAEYIQQHALYSSL